VRAATDNDNLPDTSAAVGGSGDDVDGGRGRTLTGKGQEPARQRTTTALLGITAK